MEVVINNCFGGFGLSDLAYEKLISYGIPVRKYIQEKRNPKTGLYDIKEPNNEGEVIFKSDSDMVLIGKYWDTWTDKNRSHPLIIKVVKELGKKASGRCADLKIVEIPDGIDWEIKEYDGSEHIAEKHKTWS